MFHPRLCVRLVESEVEGTLCHRLVEDIGVKRSVLVYLILIYMTIMCNAL